MSFFDLYARYRDYDLAQVQDSVSPAKVAAAIGSQTHSIRDLAILLSPTAEDCLEQMAHKARRLTLANFGRTMQLYTPLYVSDHCVNRCQYCGFNGDNQFARTHLSLDEVAREAKAIAATGLKHILLLCGESRLASPVDYLVECVQVLRNFFSAIAIEVYALEEAEYARLIEAGVDGLTIYQETYDENVYAAVHPAGPKRDFAFRLEAPERGSRAGMRQVNIGALLGLAGWRQEAFMLGLHAWYLMKSFPEVEVGISLPRLRPHAGGFQAACPVDDKALVQILLALRLFLPHLGISLSTREDQSLRDNLLPLGITRLSAGSITRVGGHGSHAADDNTLPQFEIADERSVDDIRQMLSARGYDPVLKDWMNLL